MKSRWYALRSKPRQERALYNYICSQDVVCYYPSIRVNPVNPRSQKTKPYFPGYMFVYSDLSEVGLNRFRWVPHSLGLVRFGNVPAEVPENLIHAIKHTVSQIQNAGEETLLGLNPGDRVLIEDGPFEGFSGIFDTRLSSQDRIRVLLTMLDSSREVPVDLKIDQISKIKPRITRSNV
jgi:transcriptional antiterminator RfaH